MKRKSLIKTILQILFDILIIFSSFILAFFLRGQIGVQGSSGLFSQYTNYIVWYILIVVIVKLTMLWAFGTYRRIWKYASLKDMIAIVESLTLSSVVIVGFFYLLSYPISIFSLEINFSFPFFPRSIFVIDFLLSLALVIVSRFSERFFNEFKFGNPSTRKKRVLIIGAGDAGEMIAREMMRQENSQYLPVGFLDDNESNIRNRIHGIKVLGLISAMEDHIKKQAIDEVIIAMPSASGKIRKEIAFRAKSTGVNCKTLPSLYEVIDGRIHLYQVRDIEIEDILGRETIQIKTQEAVSKIKDKIVLVTGAGGSIGAEICRQLLRFNPAKLIMIDHSENNLFLVEDELSNKLGFNSAIPVVADIRDKEVMKSVFGRYKPAMVFHTAAYKHVPLMQLNPEAAIQNNFLGTKNIAQISSKIGVNRFIILSSDKAVKPKNIMGVSKLLTEKYVQAFSRDNITKFIIVRFGNVLESHGSVVNLFKEQINSGGPVRVTHPDMSRYLMTISEASQLAIQSCIMGKGGEVYVLNMGKPINILELAKNMIKLYGMRPGEDIKIIYTGPRKGEKIYEELIDESEELVVSGFKHIFRIKNNGRRSSKIDDEMINILFNIEKEIQTNDYNNLFKDLKKLVPDFDEKKMWFRL